MGLKEIWQVPEDHPHYRAGRVLHGAGWPLNQTNSNGGSFLYHLDNNQIVVGLIVDLNYSNPHLSPFDEFQRFKHHPLISQYLEGGERIAMALGRLRKVDFILYQNNNSLGGLLIGCDAGTLNSGKIKGSHTAMKSGMLAAEAVFSQLTAENSDHTPDYQSVFEQSWLHSELHLSRNFASSIHRYGAIAGGALATLNKMFGISCLTERPHGISQTPSQIILE